MVGIYSYVLLILIIINISRNEGNSDKWKELLSPREHFEIYFVHPHIFMPRFSTGLNELNSTDSSSLRVNAIFYCFEMFSA